MTPTTLKEAHKVLLKARCPEDVFGDLNGDPPASLKAAYRSWAKVTHVDLYTRPADKKTAHEAFTKLQSWHGVAEEKITRNTYGDRNHFDPVTIKTKTSVYTVTERITSGDLCEVYGGTGKDKKPVVLKVTRSPANNDMVTNESAQLKNLWANAPSRKLKAMARIPELIDSFELTQDKIKKRVNVFPRLDGYFTLAEVIKEYPDGLDPRDAAWMWNRLLTALLVAHQADVVHGAMLPKHFMVCPSAPNAHDGILIDWSYAVKKGEKLKAICPAERDYYPEEVFAKKPAHPSMDIYMAALCMVRLLGGKVVGKRVDIPLSVPRRSAAFCVPVCYRTRIVTKTYGKCSKNLKNY